MTTRQQVLAALAACDAKKAEDLTVLEMDQSASAFTDYFVICSGANPRQVQAIADEVAERLERAGQRATHVEGYHQAEWVLLDYVDFVVHVFAPAARKFYDLERLWKSAKRMTPAELAASKPKPKRKTAARPAARARSKSKASTRSRSAKKRVRKAS
jgi:ribosome-associated protein